MAGLLAHGSGGDGGDLPGLGAQTGMSQWRMPSPLSAYSCGGSRGVAPRSLFTLRMEGPSRPVYDPARVRSNNLRPRWRAVGQERPCRGAVGGASPALALRRHRAGVRRARWRRESPPTAPAAAGPGSRWRRRSTLAAALDNPAPVLVDCLTLWLTNLLLAGAGARLARSARRVGRARRRRPCWCPMRSGWASCRTTPWPGGSGTSRERCIARSPPGRTGSSSWWRAFRWW